MSLTQALAIWGAVTGTTGSILAILNFLRDRPRLKVRAHPWGGPGPQRSGVYEWEAGIDLLVTNSGRQPITIVEGGFSWDWRTVGRWPRRRTTAAGSTSFARPRELLPAVVKPGEVFEIPSEASYRDLEALNVQFLRPYVEDSLGNVIWEDRTFAVDELMEEFGSVFERQRKQDKKEARKN